MMKILYIPVAFLVASILSSCVTANKATEVILPPKRMSYSGFSFMPLDEQGWYIFAKTSNGVALSKRGSNDDETYAIVASGGTPPGGVTSNNLVDKFREQQREEMDGQRYKLISLNVSERSHKLAPCALSHRVVEDNEAVKRTNKSGAMILDEYSLVCLHPIEENMSILVTYSRRHYPEDEDATFENVGRNIFDSLEFERI